MKPLFKLYPYFLFAALFFTACQKKEKENILSVQAGPEEKAATQKILLQTIQESGVQNAGFKQLSTSEYCEQLKKSSKSKIDERTIALLDSCNIYQKGDIYYLVSKKAQSGARAQAINSDVSEGYNVNSNNCDCLGSLANCHAAFFDDNCNNPGLEGAQEGLLNVFELLRDSDGLLYQGAEVGFIDSTWIYINSGLLTITWTGGIYMATFDACLSANPYTWINHVNS